MIFTVDLLRRLCPQPESEALTKIAAGLEEYAAGFAVDTLLRRAHFIAQVAHESGGLKRLVENLSYSATRIADIWPKLAARATELERRPVELANAAYANRIGNGDEASGDGWRYRGRGLIQLTGKANYRARGVALGLDLIGNPDQAAVPEMAARIALSFWQSSGCNAAADLDDVEKVTRIVNGGTHGLEQRLALTKTAKTIFIEQPSEGAIA